MAIVFVDILKCFAIGGKSKALIVGSNQVILLPLVRTLIAHFVSGNSKNSSQQKVVLESKSDTMDLPHSQRFRPGGGGQFRSDDGSEMMKEFEIYDSEFTRLPGAEKVGDFEGAGMFLDWRRNGAIRRGASQRWLIR